MILAIRSSKNEALKLQLSSLLGLSSNNIACSKTNYLGISLLTIKDTSITTVNSIKNIEALQINVSTARVLKNPDKIKTTLSFNSLKNVAPIEQYDHLSQLFYIQKNKVY